MSACTRFALGLAALLAALAAPAASRAEGRIIIGTAAFSGVYHQVGAALCRFVNVRTDAHGIKCRAEESGGSVANIAGVTSGDVQFAIVQEDVLHDAYRGLNGFRGAGPNARIRTVMHLYHEQLALVVGAAVHARGVPALRGRRVNIGAADAGYRVTAARVLAALGLAPGTDVTVTELPATEHGAALCDGRIDAFFHVIGHPNQNIATPIRQCGARLLALPDAAQNGLAAQHPYYSATTIPGGLYPGHPESTPTIGVRAVLVAAAETPSATVELMVRSVLKDAAQLRRLHAVLSDFSEESVFAVPIAPLHDGSIAFQQSQIALP
jgi:TRAP transporter TAXI family solute receptor